MYPYTTSKKRRLRLFSQLTGWLLRRHENHTCQVFCLGFLLFCSLLPLFHLYNWRLCIFRTLGNEYMLQQTRFPLPSQISHVLGGRAQYTRGTFRQVPTGRIRLSFVECAYLDLCNLLHNFRCLQWISLQKRMALNFR